MGYSALPPSTTLCRAPLWAAPPSSTWFAPHHLGSSSTMNKMREYCRPLNSPQSDTDCSNSSSDSRDVLSYSSPQREVSPESCKTYPAVTTSPHAAHLETPTRCMWKGCGKAFNQLDNLSSHVAAEHAVVEEGLFYCGWEGCLRGHRGFNARYKMLVHVRTHTKERPHSCNICGKSFSRAENLKIHARSHSGEKPYVCTVPGCGKAYSNSSDRFKHTRTHMVEKPYCCKIPGCQKRYTDPSSLRKHVKTFKHTNTNLDTATDKQKEIINDKKNVDGIAKEQEFYNKYDNFMAKSPNKVTTSVSESEVYDTSSIKPNTRQYSYSENDCYENVEAGRFNKNVPRENDIEYISNVNKTINESFDEEDESNKLCFCKDLPCIHTIRYVQPEYLTVETLSYDKIEDTTKYFSRTDLGSSEFIIEEPLNLKRKFYENHYEEVEKRSKTDFHTILMNDCIETPLDLSNKSFF